MKPSGVESAKQSLQGSSPFGAVAGARAALRLTVADLPLRLGRAEGGTRVGGAAAQPSLHHGGDGWVGDTLYLAALHCTLGVKGVSPLGRAQLSAQASPFPCPAACPSLPRGVEVSATRSRTQVSGLARAPSGAWGRGRLLVNPGGAWRSGRCLVVWRGLRFG